ncbi:TPA: exopolyphosphatase [Candidatus Avigastranaerophilus faecigallinarum]|nr:exopolyphosphatase [Candidatus Avigastranaerophilus faecigallinarum]
MSETYTLYTRSNFDGLVCAALLKEIGLIDEVKFVHPKDVQDGKIQLGETDITASLPYCSGVYMAFDHHSSEAVRTKEVKENYIIEPAAPSSARIIYEYFGGEDRFSSNLHDLMDAVDKADCTNFSENDVLNPQGWVFLNYLMDPRTGLGRFRNFTISNYNLMLKLVDLCPKKSITEIMEDPDVRERIALYNEEKEKFKEQIKRCTKVDEKIAILDVRNEELIHVGNRFMIYALFPECNVSIHIFDGKQKQNTVFAVGKSIVNRSCPIDIGAMMYEYEGGGHMNAGTCQVDNDKADETLKSIIEKIKKLEAESAAQD